MDFSLLHHVGESIVNSLSILFNLLLLYLIAFHSNFGTPVYQVMLAIDASLDLALSIVVLVGQPICFTGGGYQVYISNGFFANLNYTFDKFMIMMFNATVLLNIMWIVIQFVYRYCFLCLRGEERSTEKANLLDSDRRCIVWAATGVAIIYIYAHTEQTREALELNYWDTSRLPVVVGAHITNWRMKSWIVFWGVSCCTSMVVVAIFELKIKRYFDTLGAATHENTRKIQKDFHRALLAMGICPLVTSSPPILFFLASAYFRWAPGPLQSLMTMGPSSITMFNPLTTMFFMRSYREKIMSFFCAKTATNSVHATRVTGLEAATSTHPAGSVASRTQ